MAAKMQETECGDGTHYVVSLAGELLNQAEGLIKMGLHPSQIVSGYEAATKAAVEYLEKNTFYEVKNIRDVEEITKCLRSTVVAKLPK
jgi:T-complex protein 1 subunit theta